MANKHKILPIQGSTTIWHFLWWRVWVDDWFVLFFTKGVWVWGKLFSNINYQSLTLSLSVSLPLSLLTHLKPSQKLFWMFQNESWHKLYWQTHHSNYTDITFTTITRLCEQQGLKQSVACMWCRHGFGLFPFIMYSIADYTMHPIQVFFGSVQNHVMSALSTTN